MRRSLICFSQFLFSFSSSFICRGANRTRMRSFLVEDKCAFPGRAIKLSIRTFVQAWIMRGGGSTCRRGKNRAGGPEKRLRSRESPTRVANEREFWATAPQVTAYPAVRPPRRLSTCRGVARKKHGRVRVSHSRSVFETARAVTIVAASETTCIRNTRVPARRCFRIFRARKGGELTPSISEEKKIAIFFLYE